MATDRRAPLPIHRSAWRNCSENRDGFRFGVPKAADRGRFDPSCSSLMADEARSRGFRQFSKRFRRGCVRAVRRWCTLA